jgi:hypothetical protein
MSAALARRLLLAAFGLGVAADWLLRPEPGPLGFAAWALLAFAVAWALPRTPTAPPGPDAASPFADASHRRERAGLIGAAAVIVSLLALRDAPMLVAANLLALVVGLLLVAWRSGGRALVSLEPRDALLGGASALAAVVMGGPLLATRDARVGTLPLPRRRAAAGFGLGALAAAPVLLVVTLLLASADPLFAQLVEDTGSLLDGVLMGHLLFVGAATWISAGALHGSIVRVGVRAPAVPGELRLPFASALPVLGGLVLLLGSWMALQLRALFGGAAYLAQTAGLTVAAYARSGFFELVVIAGIVLAVLLVADDVLERDAGPSRRRFRQVGQLLLALVAAVLASAVFRLGLYIEYHGLSADRLLALAILVWVAAVLAWFGMTVLRGVRTRFAPGVLVVSAVWLGLLNLASPERLVVAVNVARAERGRSFDVAYHARLSADAVPSLLASSDRLPAAQGEALRAELRAAWRDRIDDRGNWRQWTVAYRRAARQLALPSLALQPETAVSDLSRRGPAAP